MIHRVINVAFWDMQLQYRNGFYAAAVFVAVVWVTILWQVPERLLAWLFPPMVLGNLMINTFYFIGGLVLLEKEEGIPEVLAVSPLRKREALLSKVLTLTLLATLENGLLIALVAGGDVRWGALLVGMGIASVLYALAGYWVVDRYESINEYLMPSIFYTSLLAIPMVVYLGGWEHPLFYFHPLQAPLTLLESAFNPAHGWVWIYGVGYGLLGIWAGFRFSAR